MPAKYVLSGTGTGIGKTLAAAALMLGLDASYWKPVQCGTEKETDTQTLRRFTGLPVDRFLPEAYVFKAALSPHRAAELENKTIEVEKLHPPACERMLIIEGAGGLLVPLTRQALMADLFARWQIPLILCARTELGTLNHTLLSLEAMRARKIPLHGILFLGAPNDDNKRTIAAFSGARVLGHIPVIEAITRENLGTAFAQNLDKNAF
ncbi:MAG: ATP-dependent dethiobiotin synthetase BioD [Proteobacteria bacterium]|nr:ATP-dependent dethiobiotin synthetase BioD [Pseudomonadota bacterium]